MVARNKVGFAVVGLGLIAQRSVLPSFRNTKRAKLVAVVSRGAQKAARVARQFRASASYTTSQFSECLANPEISAVYIATPPGEHESFAVQAASFGKHVLCEKPLAATVEQSARIVDACERRGVMLMTAYRKYFEPSSICLKRLIRSRKLGRIDVIHTAFSELYKPGITQAWLVDPALAGGGPLMDLGVYCVNTTRWIVDEDPVEVSAQTWTRDSDNFRNIEEGVTFRLLFPSGLVVQGSTSYGAALSSFVFVQGTKGWASLAQAFPFDEMRRLSGKIGKRNIDKQFKLVDEFALEIDAFSAAVQGGKGFENDGVEGHRDMIIIDAIYNSARKARSLVIDYGNYAKPQRGRA